MSSLATQYVVSSKGPVMQWTAVLDWEFNLSQGLEQLFFGEHNIYVCKKKELIRRETFQFNEINVNLSLDLRRRIEI